MRDLQLVATLLLLTACGHEKNATDRSTRDGASIASMSITDRQDARNEAVTPISPPASAREPAPLPAPVETIPGSEARYRAIGTEPFWAVTIKGEVATLERPDKAPVHFPVSRNADGRTIRYIGDGFSMTVSEGPCSDGMSDAVWSDHVAIAFGEGTLKGCGGDREDDEGVEAR